MTRIVPTDVKNAGIPSKPGTRTTRRNAREFFAKYFLEGQNLNNSLKTEHEIQGVALPFHERYRKYIAFVLPFLFFQICWWSLAIRYDLFRLYPARYEMAITMVFGALVGGATSEGGGAVAFPVMTLLLNVPPIVARDFSLMIQSTGMAASSFTILWMRVKLEWSSIIFSGLGAAVSIILGLQFFDNILTPQQKKMMFVSIWFAFAMSLLILNLQRKRVTYHRIPQFNWWKAVLLFVTGMFGGILTAFTGSGVDICSFSMLTLLFRVSEKVATPTSIILMWMNSWVGFYWRQLIMTDISVLAWEYFAVSVPVVVLVSPVGAFISSHLHRQVLAAFVYALETIAVIGFLITGPPLKLIAAGAVIIVIGSLFFYAVSYVGARLSDSIETTKGNSNDIIIRPTIQSNVSSAVDLKV
ncbi:hypothetical protein M3Y94_01198100 [Aphelenchoides besseyi]|nr:hypothetical protein M3Y94_01198100 [Aphelenchoides besseyi]